MCVVSPAGFKREPVMFRIYFLGSAESPEDTRHETRVGERESDKC